MNTTFQTQMKAVPSSSFTLTHTGLLQRKCTFGNHKADGESKECSEKKRSDLQTNLMVNEPGDIYEREADRIADQVMATPAHHGVIGAPIGIQRVSGQGNGQMDTAPASVDHVLAGTGKPLEPALRQDMERRFGHDFSRVQVHSGAEAEQSARDLEANAYTVGHNMVFGAGRFVPGTYEGRRLIAHELAHVVQQQATVNGTTSHYLARAPQTSASDSAAAAQARAQAIARIFKPGLSLDEVMGIIDSIRPSESESGMYALVGGGEVVMITQDEYNKIRASAQKTLIDGLRKVRRKTEDAQNQYDAQHKIDEDQWFVSGAVRLFGGIKDPGESVRQNVRFATVNADAAQVMIEHGHLVRGAEFFSKSEVFATTAKKTSQAYVDNVISTAETTVTVLEVTAVTAGVTVVVIGGILAAPAIAAAAQAAPLVITLGTASVPAATAPVVAAEVAVVAAPAAAIAVPAAAVAVPAAAVAVPAAAVAAPATVAAVAAPATASTFSTAVLATAALASTTLSSDSPKPTPTSEEPKKRRNPGAYPILWPAVFGPPMLFGVPIINFIRTPNAERDMDYAWEVRRELWARHRGTDPELMPRDWHAHHIVPLFLGGLEGARGNVTFLPGRLHLSGHGQLASQPQMERPPPPLIPLPRNIYQHPVGTPYELVGFK
jgi:hypothetical protein